MKQRCLLYYAFIEISAISSQQISGKNSESKLACHEKVSQKSVVRSRGETLDPATHVYI